MAIDELVVTEMLAQIEEFGKNFQGKRELINFLKGKRNSPTAAIKAACYGCNGYYSDGRFDCGIDYCPLYTYNPYGVEKKKSREVNLSEEQKKEISNRLTKFRLNRRKDD
jgi:hypothetical protein